ncbi:MAG: glycosyltransferase family 41 protein [Acetobacteraceae bacterium]|nr:glycosyltransferase family 41 protein [Acetobacteraceae bacterium]
MANVHFSSQMASSVPVIRTGVLLDRARALYEVGDRSQARTICRQILLADPLNTDGLTLLGATLADDQRLDQALSTFDDVIRIAPADVTAWYNRGILLAKLGHAAEALASFDRVIELRPGNDSGHTQRAITLCLLGRFEEALMAFDRVQALSGMDGALAINRGVALLGSGRPVEAIASHDLALTLDPGNAKALANKGMAMMLLGDYPGGGLLYEARWTSGQLAPKRQWPRPLWLGQSSLAGKTILLHDEQGLGDALQFCRYATLAAQAGARVILMVEPPLATLMETLRGVSRVLTFADEMPDHDLQCPLMSLPLAFGTTLDTIPAEIPYLCADPSRAAEWENRLAGLPGRRIGLVWSGASRAGHQVFVASNQRRSTSLTALAPLAAVRGCSFVSVQVGAPAQEARSPPAGMVLHDYTEALRDFADTAALIENLDLVIGVDTSVVHLAGAMGKPVWLLNRFDTCWRWLLNRDDSPWYPTLRQFRQQRPGDWAGVVGQVAHALHAFAGARI